MTDIGVFSPEQARLLWQDYLTRQQLPAQLTKHYPQRRPIEDVSPHRVFVKNTEAEEVPAFGCMRITGVEDIGAKTALTIEKPTDTDGEFLFNGPYPIAASANGWGYRYGIVGMLGDEPSEVGAEYTPVVDSWEIEEDGGPFVVFGRDQTNERALIGRFKGGSGGGGSILFGSVVDTNCDDYEDSSSWCVEPMYYSGGCESIPDIDYDGNVPVTPLPVPLPFTSNQIEDSGYVVAFYMADVDNCSEMKWYGVPFARNGCEAES